MRANATAADSTTPTRTPPTVAAAAPLRAANPPPPLRERDETHEGQGVRRTRGGTVRRLSPRYGGTVLERLWPDPGPVAAHDLVAPLRGVGLLLNMVATVDGRAAVGGRSGPIGREGDHALFHALREVPDAVLVGTGTLRAERYGRLVRSPQRRARREAAGLTGDPVALLVTRSGDLPWEAPLFAEPAQRVIVFGPAEPPGAVTAQVDVRPYAEPPAALAQLRSDGLASVLCEGGPRLNRTLFAAGAVDELLLTLGPMLTAGAAAAIVADPELDAPAELGLRWVVRHGDELFLRYGTKVDAPVR